MSNDRYENIRQALEMGPTHGPWHATKPEPHGTEVRGPARVSLVWCGCATTVGEEGRYSIGAAEAAANAHFIAACDPDTIRELLDERDTLAAEVEQLAEALKKVAQSLEWYAHGRCRGFDDGAPLSTNEAVDLAERTLAKVRA